MEKFKVAIVGSRGFNDYQFLIESMDYMLSIKSKTHKIEIICGCARGADTLGKQYGISKGYDVIEMPAEWDKYGKSAGYRRNEAMSVVCDAVVAFWDGRSPGTKHMIDICKGLGKQVQVYIK